MAKKISSSDIFDKEDIFIGIRDSAQKTITMMNNLQKEVMETANALKNSIGGAKFDSAKAIKNVVDVTSKANKLKKESIQIDKLKKDAMIKESKALQELEKIEQQKLKTQSQQMRNDKQQRQEKERLQKINQKAIKTAKDESDAYKKLVKNTRDLKNESKKLGAELLALEQSGKKNTKAYKDLSNQYKKVTASAQKGDKALKKIDKSVGDNFRNVGNYTSALGKLQGGFAKLGLAFGGIRMITSIFKNFLGTFTGFSKELSGLQAILGASASDMGLLSDQAKQLGASTQFTAKEVLQLQTELAKLGFTTKEIQASTEATLNLASSLDVGLGEASQLAGSTLRAFGLSTEETTRVVDVLAKSSSKSALGFESLKESLKLVAPTSKAMGVSLEDTTAMLGVLADNGLKGSIAGTGLSKTFIMLNKAGVPLNEALDQVANSSNQLNTAIDLVGVVGAKSLLTLANNSKKIDVLADSLENAEGSAKKLAETRLDNLAGDTTKLGSAWEGFLLSIEDGEGMFNGLLRGIIQATTALLGFLTPTKSITEALEDERTELFLVESELNNVNTTQERRNEIITTLQEKYPDYLGNLEADKVTNEELSKAIEKVNKSLVNKIILQEKEEEILEQAEETADAVKERIEQETLALEQMAKIRKKLSDQGRTFAKVKGTITQQTIGLINELNKERSLNDKLRQQGKKTLSDNRFLQKSVDGLILRRNKLFQANRIVREEEAKGNALYSEKNLIMERLGMNTKKVTKETEELSEETTESTKVTKAKVQSLKEYKEGTDKVIDSVKALKEQEEKRRQTEQKDVISGEIMNAVKTARETGEARVEVIEDMMSLEAKKQIEFLEQQRDDEIAFNKIELTRKQTARSQELDKEFQTKLQKINESKSTEKEAERTKLQEIYDDRIQQLEYLNGIEQIELQASEDVKNGLLEESTDKILRTTTNQINGYNDKINEALEQYADEQTKTNQKLAKEQLENTKKTQQTLKEVVKSSSDYFVKQSQRRIDVIDEEINKQQERYDEFKQLAIEGNIDAKESLAVQQKIINEANKKKLEEEKKQQRIRLAESVFNTYSSKVQSNSANPLAETIRDTSLLLQFINSIPAFFDGTEDTGSNGQGVDGRGGFHAVLHPNERVVPKSLNQQIGDLTNEELTKIAVDYKNGRVVEGATQMTSSMDLAILVNELTDIKKTIENKPETNIELGEITQSMMEVVKSTRKGNTIVYNRYKIKK